MYKPNMLTQTLDCGVKIRAYFLYWYEDHTLAIVSKTSKSWNLPSNKMFINNKPVRLALI